MQKAQHRPILFYDSGWFAVSRQVNYTKAHGLAKIPFNVTVWYSDTNDGSGDVVLCDSPSDAAHRNITMIDLDATNIVLRGQTSVCDYYDQAAARNYPNSGFCRVQAQA